MNKIDFALVISAQLCNPNGDPLNGNRPRQEYDGHGYISDVCLKHKIRNRFSDFGEKILNIENSRVTDNLFSIGERVRAEPSLKEHIKKKDSVAFIKEACRIWMDVRTFGQVFALKDTSGGASVSARGPVSIGYARSLDIIDIINFPITRSTNLEESAEWLKKDSGTMGVKYIIDKGAYAAYGSVFPQLAELTGFSEKDLLLLKDSLATIFENDVSESRPSGSMGSKLFWWEHDCPSGRDNSLNVHHYLHLTPKSEFPFYDFDLDIAKKGIELSIM